MKYSFLSRPATTAIACLSIVLVAYLCPPLHAAIPEAPAVPAAEQPAPVTPKGKVAKWRKVQEQPSWKKVNRKWVEIKKTGPTTSDTVQEKYKRVYVSERNAPKTPAADAAQTTTPPATRNLIMIFDDGHDTGAMTAALTTALVQRSAFILITPALWQLLRTRSIFAEKGGTGTDAALKKSLEDFALQEAEKQAGPNASQDAITKAAQDNLAYANIFFNPAEWEAYQIDVVPNDVFFYLLIPNAYKAQILGAGEKTALLNDQKLGLNLSILKTVDLTQTPTATEYSTKFKFEGNVAKALGLALVPSKTQPPFHYSWNVYCDGHGEKSKKKETIAFYDELLKEIDELEKANTPEARQNLANRFEQYNVRSVQALKDIFKQQRDESGMIASLTIPSFKAITDFFNDAVFTNFFFYSTCYAGGEHLLSPFVNSIGTPARLNYPIAAGTLMYITSKGFGGSLSRTKPSDKLFGCDLKNINSNLPAGWFVVEGDFVHFFANLEDFAQGKKNYEKVQIGKQPPGSPLIQTCAYIGNFLNPDGSIKNLGNIPQIRFPGTEWFQVTQLGKGIDVTQITRTMVLQKNIQLKLTGAGKVPGFDLTSLDPTQDKKIVLLRTNYINIPTTVDQKTFLVPLINTTTFLETKQSEREKAQEQLKTLLGTPDIPLSFYFNLVTSPVGFFDLLTAVWLRPELTEKWVDNFVFVIDTLVCHNDLSIEQFKLLEPTPTEKRRATFATDNDFLELHKVMIFVRLTKKAANSLQNPLIFFTYNNHNFVIKKASQDTIEIVDDMQPSPTDVYKILYACCKEPSTEYYTFDDKSQQLYYTLGELKAQHLARAKMINDTAENVFKQLLSEGETVSTNTEQAIQALTLTKLGSAKFCRRAAKDLISDNDTVRNSIINVFKVLWYQGKGIDEALKIAVSNIGASNDNVAKGARDVFFALSIHALTCFRLNGPDWKKSGLAIFKKLFAHGQGFVAAKGAISLCEKTTEHEIQAVVKELSAALAKAEAEAETKAEAGAKAKEEAAAKKEETFYQQAAKDLASNNTAAHASAIEVFKKLWNQGKGIDEALNLAVSNLAAGNENGAKGAEEVFAALAFHALLCFTANVVECPNGKKSALAIFKKLFAHGQGFYNAKIAIKACEKAPEHEVQAVVKELSDALAKAEAEAKKKAEAEAKAKEEAAAKKEAETKNEAEAKPTPKEADAKAEAAKESAKPV